MSSSAISRAVQDASSGTVSALHALWDPYFHLVEEPPKKIKTGIINPLTLTAATAIKHSVLDRVKPSFVKLTSIHSYAPEWQSARMSKITNDGLAPVWHRMLYSCTHMATVGVTGLNELH